jgi:hypothetical protein
MERKKSESRNTQKESEELGFRCDERLESDNIYLFTFMIIMDSCDMFRSLSNWVYTGSSH